jgi:hypothetical protein
MINDIMMSLMNINDVFVVAKGDVKGSRDGPIPNNDFICLERPNYKNFVSKICSN